MRLRDPFHSSAEPEAAHRYALRETTTPSTQATPTNPTRLTHRLRQPRPPVLRFDRPATFTHRQLECLTWVQEGKSATDIGAILGLSPRTVEGHLAKICAAFGVRTRIQAVLKAKELGLLDARQP